MHKLPQLAGRLRLKLIITTLRLLSLYSMLRARTPAWVAPMSVKSARSAGGA